MPRRCHCKNRYHMPQIDYRSHRDHVTLTTVSITPTLFVYHVSTHLGWNATEVTVPVFSRKSSILSALSRSHSFGTRKVGQSK